MHPNRLFEILKERYPELDQFPDKKIHRYTNLMMRAVAPGLFRHKLANGVRIPMNAISLSSRYLDRRFGRNVFDRINASAQCFERIERYFRKRNLSRAYWLSAEGHQAIQATQESLREGQENTLVDKDGRRIRRKPNAVYTKTDIEGRRAATKAQLHSLVPLNMDAIDRTVGVGVERLFPDISQERLGCASEQLSALQTLALKNQFGVGVLHQTYREVTSGRLYTRCGLSLQNMMREVRRIALADQHEYDFGNCHFRLMEQFAQQHGIEVPSIRQYVEDTERTRVRLADRLGISRDNAKECLLALMNRAVRTEWHEASIPSLIGVEKARELYADPEFDALVLEVVEVGDRMRRDARRRSDGATLNCRDKACKGDARQVLSHLLQGQESMLLHIVIRQYGGDILVIQHDGWTMSRQVDPREIEQLLLRETGIWMPVKHEQLLLPDAH